MYRYGITDVHQRIGELISDNMILDYIDTLELTIEYIRENIENIDIKGYTREQALSYIDGDLDKAENYRYFSHLMI